MKFRELCILAASIGLVVPACAGKEFSSAPVRSEIGGKSEPPIGGQFGTGGQLSASGGDAIGGTENRVSSSISSNSGGGATSSGGTQTAGGSFDAGGAQPSGGTSSSTSGGEMYTGGALNIGGTLSIGGSTLATHTGGTTESSIGGSAATGGSTTMAYTGGSSHTGGASSIGGTHSTGGRFTRPHSGGNAQTGGDANTGGTESTETTAAIPEGWACDAEHYGTDDGCDCGCGALDPDCGGEVVAGACVSANAAGSCGRSTGWGINAILANDNTQCISVPDGWSCAPAYYGDGACHCGCGIIDSDCANSDAATCRHCGGLGSCAAFDRFSTCETIDPTDNSKCVEVSDVPPLWTCSPSHYGTKDGCDCGCGAVDPDCANDSREACDRCTEEGACSYFVGCDLLKFADNAHCAANTWHCDPSWKDTGNGCNCGCGLVDLDCRNTLVDACLSCSGVGSCAHGCGQIDPNANGECVDPQ